MKKRVSIVICTVNREEVLCETLRCVVALIRQRDDTELIVVDQTRKHQEATEQCLTELADIIKLHRVEVASLTRARNHGIMKAVGEIVLFLDDDVQPSSNLIDAHLACYAEPDVWGVGGCTLLRGGRKFSRSDLRKGELADLDSGRANRFDLDWPRKLRWAPGCNMSFRREKLFMVGGFDEAFYGMAIGEEVELCHRVCERGGVIVYSPDAELVHLVNPVGGCRDAHAEEERMAQMFDNALYMMRRTSVPWGRCWWVLLRQCKTNALNRKSLREGTWLNLGMMCLKGLRRALSNMHRQPLLPLPL